MKKRYLLLLIICFLFSISNVRGAELCNQTIVSTDTNFYCGDENNSNLSFSANNVVYTKYFSLSEADKRRINIADMTGLMSVLPTTEKNVKITIFSNGTVIGYVTVVNVNYVEPTTTQPTTEATTTVANSKVFKVIFEHNDGTNEKTERQCQTTTSDGGCAVTAPKLEKENFKGWGTKNVCKQGNSGSFMVTADTTYYACYETQEQTSTVPYLESLKLLNQANDQEIDIGVFSVKKNKYSFIVENNIENIKVVANADDSIKIDIVGNTGLKVGEENVLTIKLTSETGVENLYEFKITRLAEGEVIDKNHYLSNLRIQPVNNAFAFNKSQFEYTIQIPTNVNELNIEPFKENETDEVSVVGNSELVDGSVIKINVTGANGEITTYTIYIEKKDSINNNNIFLIIGGVLLAIILVLCIVVFIKSNKKSDPNKPTQSNPPKETKKKEKKVKKSKKEKNTPEVLPDSNNDIEILKF